MSSREFEQRTDFQESQRRRQVEWKRTKYPDLEDGTRSQRPGPRYAHILPRGHLEKNFYPPIYPDVVKYLREEGIALHREALNLLSSQVCCFNFMYPLKQDLSKASSILSKAISGLDKVLNIEFEYTGPGSATEWLGEPPGGKRGQNRTSIDAAVWWKDQGRHTRLTLVEWKYTERGFGKCGGDRSAGKDQQPRCDTLKVHDIRPERDCYVASANDDHTSRRYWEHLAGAGISLKPFGDRSGCPFRGPFYQLMRQYLLAAHCRAKLSEADSVDVIVIGFQGNQHLLRRPQYLAHLGEDVVTAWNSILSTAPPLQHVLVETVLADAPSDDWREYIRERYGV